MFNPGLNDCLCRPNAQTFDVVLLNANFQGKQAFQFSRPRRFDACRETISFLRLDDRLLRRHVIYHLAFAILTFRDSFFRSNR